MSRDSEAYKNQAKAPKKGVKADDADEHDNMAIEGWDKSVSKGGAYRAQAKAPETMGMRGPSQADGSPIDKWDKSVDTYCAYEEQFDAPPKGSSKSDPMSLGFKPSGMGYLGHFTQEKYLMQGHNDGGTISEMLFGAEKEANQDVDKAEASSKTKTRTNGSNVNQPDDDDDSGRASAQKSMRKAFNYSDDD